jgi:hypothetical protein
VRNDVRICRLALAALAALGPAAELGVASGCASLALTGCAPKQGTNIDFAFLSTVRACVLHAQNLTQRSLWFTVFFKVAHYPKSAHPDAGGSREKWLQLQEAYDQAMALFRKEAA